MPVLLDDNPALGKSAEDIKTGYRRFAHESHLIFYQEHPQGVFIVRILHKSMDVERHLTGEIKERLEPTHPTFLCSKDAAGWR